jgi:site-specific DNA-adenine methylase
VHLGEIFVSKIKTLFPAFGGNRTNAEVPGAMLGKCDWAGVVFAGGMPEVPHINARSIVVNDKHLHIVNCARAVRDHGSSMTEFLNATMFHPQELERAQEYCQKDLESFVSREDVASEVNGFNGCHYRGACMYFITQWMGRSGQSSTGKEFNGNLSTRWTSSGGDSAVRFRSATEAIADFQQAFKKCSFTRLDFREFLGRVVDSADHGLYCDPPWPDLGEEYKFPFNEDDQKSLASMLNATESIKIVMRFGDHEMIRDLYKESDGWKWKFMTGRTQGNSKQAECFISKRCE